MEKRWWQYERRPKSQYLLFMAIMSAIFAAAQSSMGNRWMCAGWAVACAVNLVFYYRERRKERAGQGRFA